MGIRQKLRLVTISRASRSRAIWYFFKLPASHFFYIYRENRAHAQYFLSLVLYLAIDNPLADARGMRRVALVSHTYSRMSIHGSRPPYQ